MVVGDKVDFFICITHFKARFLFKDQSDKLNILKKDIVLSSLNVTFLWDFIYLIFTS